VRYALEQVLTSNSYHVREDCRVTHPNHTLHTDLLVVPKEGPYRYLLLVVDEFTRYIFSTPSATKDKAAKALLCIMKRAQVLHLNRIKYIHNDRPRGGEFSTVLRIAREELGIVTAFVPARGHESNGLVTGKSDYPRKGSRIVDCCMPP
jgi:hypothetical protein